MSDTERRHHFSPTALDVLILKSPFAGARSGTPAVDELTFILGASGFRVSQFAEPDRLVDAVEQRQAEGTLRAVVAAGGDGTVSLIANKTPVGTPIVPFPLGTENLLAKYLKISRSGELVCRILQRGDAIRLDAGRANGRLFLLMVGCGFDAEVVRRLHGQRSGHIQHASYAKPILQSIRSYRYPELRVYSSLGTDSAGDQLAATGKWAFAVNLPRYGGGLRITPQAVGDDSLLDVCVCRHGGVLHGLRYLANAFWGRLQYCSDVVNLRAERVRIESDSEVPYQLDGDPGGLLPVDVEIVPGRLTLLVPPSWVV